LSNEKAEYVDSGLLIVILLLLLLLISRRKTLKNEKAFTGQIALKIVGQF
jgi:hypothetical protein